LTLGVLFGLVDFSGGWAVLMVTKGGAYPLVVLGILGETVAAQNFGVLQ
jgi:hypothetical protein